MHFQPPSPMRTIDGIRRERFVTNRKLFSPDTPSTNWRVRRQPNLNSRRAPIGLVSQLHCAMSSQSLKAGTPLKDLYAALCENFPCDPNMKMVEGVSEIASQLGVTEDQLKGKTMMEKLLVLCDAAGIAVAQQVDTPKAPAEPAGGGVGGGMSPRPGNYGGGGNMRDTRLTKEEMAKIAQMEQERQDEELARQLAKQEQNEAS